MTEADQCREMAEASWKAFLTFAAQGSGELGKECILRFEEKIARQARDMGSDGARWLAVMEEQRALIFDEYVSNPEGLKRRLGVPAPQQVSHVSGQSLGDLAVRTTVRASIWATVSSIFRWFR